MTQKINELLAMSEDLQGLAEAMRRMDRDARRLEMALDFTDFDREMGALARPPAQANEHEDRRAA